MKFILILAVREDKFDGPNNVFCSSILAVPNQQLARMGNYLLFYKINLTQH